MRGKRLLAAVTVLATMCASAAWAAPADVPVSFEVGSFPQAPDAQQSDNSTCTVSGQGDQTVKTCTTPFDLNGYVSDLTGVSVSTTYDGTSLQGTITGSCTWNVHEVRIIVHQNGTGTPNGGTRSEDVGCSFTFNFDHNTTMVLTAHSDASPRPLDDKAGRGFGGTITSTNTDGVFQGANGSWSQGPSPSHDTLAGAISSVIAGALDGSTWSAHLHKGAPLADFALPAPGATLIPGQDPGVLVAAAPNVTCIAVAASAGKTVKLGSASTGKTGFARLAGKVMKLLTPGTWNLSATCGKATAKEHITITR